MTMRTRPLSYGVTMVELMVSITIGLLVVLVVVSFFGTSRQSGRMNTGHAQMQDNARIGLDTIGRIAQQAGYSDQVGSSTDASGNWVYNSASMSSASAVVGTLTTVSAFASYSALSAINTSPANQSDILDLAYETGPQSSSNAAMPDCLGNPQSTNVVVKNEFYIDVESITNAQRQTVIRPVLMCKVYLNGTLSATGVIAENIEKMMVLFGVGSSSSGPFTYYSTTTIASTSGFSWSNVYSIRVALLARQDPVGNQARAELNNGVKYNLFGNAYASSVSSSDPSWVNPVYSSTTACTSSTPCWPRRVFESMFALRNKVQ